MIDKELVAGIVYHNYIPGYASIDISMAAITPSWASRSRIHQLLRYPFIQLECNRVNCLTPRRATSPRRFLKGIGFKEEGVAREGFGVGRDAVLYGLLRREWERGPFGPRPVSGEVVSFPTGGGGPGSDSERPISLEYRYG